MKKFKGILFLILVLSLVFPLQARASKNICEEDAAKIAMSHYIKNYSCFHSNPNAKVVVEKIEPVNINGYNGKVSFYNVKLSKYYKETLVKISDLFMYQIERQNAEIVAVQSIADPDTAMKSALVKELSSESLAASKSIDYEKYAAIMSAYYSPVLDELRQLPPSGPIHDNLNTLISGINLYKPNLKPMISEFENGYKTVRLMR